MVYPRWCTYSPVYPRWCTYTPVYPWVRLIHPGIYPWVRLIHPGIPPGWCVQPGIPWVVCTARYTLGGICPVYIPGWYMPVYIPGYTSSCTPALPHCPTRRCRRSPLQALEHGVTKLTVSDGGVTVRGYPLPVSLLVIVEERGDHEAHSPLFLLGRGTPVAQTGLRSSHPFHCWGCTLLIQSLTLSDIPGPTAASFSRPEQS